MTNKKEKILICFLVFIVFCAAAVKSLRYIGTIQNAWVVANATVSTGAEPNDLAVDERTYVTVKAVIDGGINADDKISIYQLPNTYNGVRFRCIGITDNSSVIHQIYFGTKGNNSDCELSKAGQLAWTIGTQVSETSTYELADTLTVTSYGWTKSWSSASPTSELVAEAMIDVQGADILVVVPTTNACDSKLLIKGY